MGLIALLCWALGAAWAVTGDELEARLTEIESHRALRIQRSAPGPSGSELQKIAAGATVTGLLDASEGSKAWGAAVVPLPIGTFWAALNDETRHPGYTAVEYSELLSGRPCRSGRRVLQYLPVPVPMFSDRWWVGILQTNGKLSQASGGSVRELSFSSSVDPSEVTSDSGKKMISQGAPIAFSRGGWFLVALDERHTYVEYYVHTDPGGRLPGGMASMFATKGVRENIAAITRFAKEAKPACPVE
jgi:hypothetical protein